MNPLIQSLTEGQLRTDIPAFRPGDTVRVHAKVVEGSRERIQIFEGVVIARKVKDTLKCTLFVKSLTVSVLNVHSQYTPRVEKIEVVRYGKVRRAKLYYLRALQGKAARIKEIVVKTNKEAGVISLLFYRSP